MYGKYLWTALVLSILICASCTPPDNGSESSSSNGSPPVDDSPPSENPAEPQNPLPFILRVNDTEVGPDRRVSVPADQISLIGITTDDINAGNLVVVLPDGESIALGEWQSDQVQFVQNFPYGENHLIISMEQNVYDILVVAAAPEPASGSTGCTNTFMNLSLDTRLVYRETADDMAPATWTHYVTNWSNDNTGNSAVTYVMDRSSGIEGNVTHSVTLDLVCTGETIFISNAYEVLDGITWHTQYDSNAVYLPADLSPGSVWERHGTFDTEIDDEAIHFSLVERLHCTSQDRISVEAGEFDALRVEYATEKFNDDESYSSEGVSWYVPGLGRVLTESTARLEMISYEGIAPSL